MLPSVTIQTMPAAGPSILRRAISAAPRGMVAALAIVAMTALPVEARGKNNDRVNENDLIKGIVASVLIGTVVNGMMQPPRQPVPVRPVVPRPPVYQQPAPVYVPQPVYAPAPVSIYQTPVARAFNSYSYYERQSIQRRLSAQGYYFGGLDGAFGPGTYNGVVAYARASGLSANLASTSGAFGVYDSLLY